MKVFRPLITALVGLVYLLPFAVLLLLALSPSGFDQATFLSPSAWRWDNFAAAWFQSGLGAALVHSLVITVGALGILVLASSMAAWAFVRYPIALFRWLFGALLACMMIPGIINTVPLYTLLIRIHGVNTLWAMALVCTANALPFSIFLYSGFLQTVPREIEEAAVIDGCTPFSAFWRITFHFLKPVTAAVVILNGISIWNNYGQAVFLLQTDEVRTVPLAISLFFQQYGAHWNLVAASAFLAVLPALAVFLGFQNYFIKGITAGAVKG
jgi:raffinose/stachyose/melibiose transport system permease protein